MPETRKVDFGLIEHLGNLELSVQRSCMVLGVSESGYYRWRAASSSHHQQRQAELQDKVVSIFEASRGRYGSPRIHRALKNQGESVGENTVAKAMKQLGLQAQQPKSFKPQTTKSDASQQKADRVFKVKQDMPSKECEVWCSDLTYLRSTTSGVFFYLVIVMDIYNREIKGWSLEAGMDGEHTRKAFLEAVKISSGSLMKMVFHSDRGGQYCAEDLRKDLEYMGIIQSMSRAGNCYDNAYAESFFARLKTELGRRKFDSLEDARRVVGEYIRWYNEERLHSSLGYLSPIQYKEKNRRTA